MVNRRLVAIICFAAFIVLGIASAVLGPTLKDLSASVALPLESAGILRAARQIGAFLAIFGGGLLLDRRDTRLILVPGMLLMAAGLVGVAATGDLAFTLMASVFLGAGTGFLDVGSNFAIGALFKSNASSVLSALHSFYGVGLFVGPLVAEWALVQNGDWRAAYIVPGALCVVLAVLFLTQAIRKQDTASKQTTEVAPKSSAVQWLPLLPLIVLIFTYNGAGTGIQDWISTHVRLVGHANVDTAARVAALYGLSLMTGRIISVGALRKFGNTRVLSGAIGLATVGAALIVFGGSVVEVIMVGVALVGVGFGPIFPTVVALGGQQQPHVRGTVTSILVGMASIGGIVLPVVQGWIGGGQSGGMIVTLVAALVLIAALVAMRTFQNGRVAIPQS
jgi:fucose permease